MRSQDDVNNIYKELKSSKKCALSSKMERLTMFRVVTQEVRCIN